jgi:hypothetical protein
MKEKIKRPVEYILADDPTEEPTPEDREKAQFWLFNVLPKKYGKRIKTIHTRMTEKEMNKRTSKDKL